MYWSFFTITSLIYIILNWMFSINFVWNYDDVFICIESFISYQKGEISLWEYLTMYLNDHPTIIERIFSLISFWVLGQINIKFLLLLSCFFPIILSYLVSNREPNYLKRYLSHCLLLSFTNSIFLWASASAIYFFPFFFFAIIMLYFLQAPFHATKLLPYSLCLFLMFYSFSNSLVSIPILSVYFLIQSRIEGFRHIWPYVILFAIIASLFVFDFYHSTHYASSSDISADKALFGSVIKLLKGVGFVLIFCGSLAKYFSCSPDWQMTIAMAFGSLLLCLLLIDFYKNYSHPSPWFWIGLFTFGSGFLVMIGRFDGLDYYYALDNRYEWFGVLTVLSVLQLTLPEIGQLRLKSIATIFLLVVFTLTGLKTGWNTLNLSRYKRLHFNRAVNFMNGSEFDIPFKTDKRLRDALKVKPIMLEAEKMGIFKIDPKIYIHTD